jgi:hypothetical protein
MEPMIYGSLPNAPKPTWLAGFDCSDIVQRFVFNMLQQFKSFCVIDWLARPGGRNSAPLGY